MSRIAFISLFALAVTGCAAGSSIGSGPITLSPQVQASYDQYRRLPSPGYFAVSRDGQHASYSYCPVGIDCRGNDVAIALDGCRRSGKECFIYDQGGRVVWRQTP